MTSLLVLLILFVSVLDIPRMNVCCCSPCVCLCVQDLSAASSRRPSVDDGDSVWDVGSVASSASALPSALAHFRGKTHPRAQVCIRDAVGVSASCS